jgi:tRNA threonylcarbamoyladenosine biosynthesis protein TsaB
VLILSIDSSQAVGSVTLARQSGNTFTVIATVEAHGGKFSAQLVPTVRHLLEEHALSKQDVDVIAAASGPGTFTGLRVGLAAVQAFAEALQKPVVLVSVLEALAGNARDVISITDAGKGGWYFGFFDGERKVEEHGDSEALARFVAEHAHTAVVTNAPHLPGGIAATHTRVPVSEWVARVAAQRALLKQFVAIDAIDANYVRADEGLYRSR